MGKTAKKIKPIVSVLPIEPKDVERFWPLAQFMVQKALNYSGKYADANHILEYCKKDEMQLFVFFGSDESEENKVFGVCVTRITQMPNYPQLEIIITTGKRRDLWENKLETEIKKFAQNNKCKRICVWARPGWERVTSKWGWKKTHVLLEKEIK